MKNINYLVTICILFVVNQHLRSQQIVAGPYLQDASPESIHIMWETNTGGESVLFWGNNKTLSDTCMRIFSLVNQYPSQVHRAFIDKLTPSTTYYYRVKTGNTISNMYHFTTPAHAVSEQSFNLVAMSDMQRDNSQVNKFKEIIDEGLLPFLKENGNNEDIYKQLSLVLIPGDLVDNGLNYSDWTNDFFRQSANLLPYVPVYPVLGNHERNSDFFFNYFHLPDNGTPGYMEHWWYKDHGNVRIIGLNSNDGYRIREQLDWLNKVLQDAAINDSIDFVFAQLHHPYKSELWIDGETDFTGEVVRQLELFSSRTGKPSIHFFGHTHGYSRGQSLNHSHLWVNVATAGGRIDGWGEYAQTNYDEFSVTRSDYGFVFMEIEAGENPHFNLYRIGRGNATHPTDNEINDKITIFRYGAGPRQPSCLAPLNKENVDVGNVILKASPFTASQGSEHGETEWQIARSWNFTNPDITIRKNYEDWYGGENLNVGIDLTKQSIEGLRENTTYFWRVRYRDKGLKWSEWSNTQSFVTK